VLGGLSAHSMHERLKHREKISVGIVRERVGKCRESRKLAWKFWTSDAVCRASPQKNDTLKVRNPDGLVSRQHRMWLECTARVAFKRFRKEFPEVVIGFTTFLSCRPANVKRFKAVNRISCTCK
jgi:hypothetical protein